MYNRKPKFCSTLSGTTSPCSLSYIPRPSVLLHVQQSPEPKKDTPRSPLVGPLLSGHDFPHVLLLQHVALSLLASLPSTTMTPISAEYACRARNPSSRLCCIPNWFHVSSYRMSYISVTLCTSDLGMQRPSSWLSIIRPSDRLRAKRK